MEGLPEKELRFRLAQAEDALLNLRKHLRVKDLVSDFKLQHTAGTGQKANTRMRSLEARYEAIIQRTAARYRAARVALHSLDPNGDWKNKFLVLDKKDVRPVGKQKGQSEGHRELSWIWLSDPVQDPAANTQGQVDLNEGKRNLSWINMASSHWCSLRRASRGMGYVSLACRTLGGREGVREGRNDTGPYQLQGSCEVVARSSRSKVD